MTNAALVERPDSVATIFNLTSVIPPRLEGNQMWVLLRIYTQDSATQQFSVTHQFAIQDGSRFLDARGNELSLAPGTYSKCYNWSNMYSVDQPINAFDPHLIWETAYSPGMRLREDYVTLKLRREMLPDDRLVIFRHLENGVIVDAGVAKQRGDKFFRADGMQITDDIQTIEIGNWFDQRIMRGDLDARDPTMNDMGWVEHRQNEFFEHASSSTGSAGSGSMGGSGSSGGGTDIRNAVQVTQNAERATNTPSNSMVSLTFYYVPYAEEERFGGSESLLRENGKLNGTYRNAQEQYVRWLRYDEELEQNIFENVSGPTTNSGTTPRADGLVTMAVPEEWRGKYILIVREGRVVVTGIGEDSGGRFTPGSSKIDVFAGEGAAGWERGFEDYYGTCRAYFFSTRSEMDNYIQENF